MLRLLLHFACRTASETIVAVIKLGLVLTYIMQEHFLLLCSCSFIAAQQI